LTSEYKSIARNVRNAWRTVLFTPSARTKQPTQQLYPVTQAC
jgi:hypothetical protein